MKIKMPDTLNQAITALSKSSPVIFLGPRPGKKSLSKLQDLNLTHCCTLLSEREQAPLIKNICKQIPGKWIWLPLEGGNLETLRAANISGLIQTLAREIEQESKPRLYFHCSAGIHRTGFFVYTLLRLMGSKAKEASTELAKLRSVTADQVGSDRLALAEEIVAELGIQ